MMLESGCTLQNNFQFDKVCAACDVLLRVASGHAAFNAMTIDHVLCVSFNNGQRCYKRQSEYNKKEKNNIIDVLVHIHHSPYIDDDDDMGVGRWGVIYGVLSAQCVHECVCANVIFS